MPSRDIDGKRARKSSASRRKAIAVDVHALQGVRQTYDSTMHLRLVHVATLPLPHSTTYLTQTRRCIRILSNASYNSSLARTDTLQYEPRPRIEKISSGFPPRCTGFPRGARSACLHIERLQIIHLTAERCQSPPPSKAHGVLPVQLGLWCPRAPHTPLNCRIRHEKDS